MCGCILEDNYDGEICPCCIDDMHDEELAEEESLYPTIALPDEWVNPYSGEEIKEIIDKRLRTKRGGIKC